MPRFTGWAVRTALVHLILGFSIGAIMLANAGIPFAPWVRRLVPAHIELLLIGWSAQFALGIAYWILPRLPGGVRGREGLAWGGYALLNLGVLAAAAGGSLGLSGGVLAGRGFELAGAVCFAAAVWPRVRQVWRPVGSH